VISEGLADQGELVFSTEDGGQESLEVLVAIVKQGPKRSKRYVAIGEALIQIRDRKVYRQTHKPFEAFVFERFRLARSSVYDYMVAAAEAGEISGTPDRMANHE
jgi:hypothetical protein